MIIRFGGGNAGVCEYLENGMKQGRDLSRDELDQRLFLDGNLALTKSVINQIDNNGQERYKHITISFSENHVSKEQLSKIVDEFKSSFMSAYDESEYNFYAEAHLPKVKFTTDKKTGEKIERKPHIHIVIPKINLVNNKKLDPVGLYNKNTKFYQAIQEKLNYDFGFDSPLDHPREHGIDKADILSRVKADSFKGSKNELKNKIFNHINNNNVKDWNDFKSVLSSYGEVKVRNENKKNEYLALKEIGDTRFTNLNVPVFKKDYIEKRELKREKPSYKKCEKLVDEWSSFKSKEIKYVNNLSDYKRKNYYSLSINDKKEVINNYHEQFKSKYNLSREQSNIRTRGRTDSCFRGADSKRIAGIKRLSEIGTGLQSLSERHLVSQPKGDQINTRNARNSLLLPIDERDSGRKEQSRSHHELRRNVYNSRRGDVNSEISSLFKSFNDHQDKNKSLEFLNDVKRNLHPKHVLNQLELDFNVDKSSYRYFKSERDGTYRIKSHGQNVTVNDLLTREFHLSWSEAKDFLDKCLEKQSSQNAKKASNEINQIIFDNRTTQFKYKNPNKQIIADSLKAFNNVKRNEKMIDNKIVNSELPSIKQQLELDRKKRLDSMKFSDLVPIKDNEKGRVTYQDQNGDKAFIDKGNHLSFSLKPNDKHIELGLKMAAEKYGAVTLKGTPSFKEKCIKIAAENGLDIHFKDKENQAKFVALKESLQRSNSEDKSNMIVFNIAKGSDIKPEQLKEAGIIYKDFKYSISKENLDNLKGFSVSNVSKSSDMILEFKKLENVLSNKQQTQHSQTDKELKQSSKAINSTDDMIVFNLAKGSDIKPEQLKEAGVSYKDFKYSISKENLENLKGFSVSNVSKSSDTILEFKKLENVLSNNQKDNAIKKQPLKGDVLSNHGEANYKFNKDEKPSYFAEFENGKILWGVGIKDALTDKNIKVGDRIDLKVTGKEMVTVESNVYKDGKIVKDDNGNNIKKTIDTERNAWSAEKYESQSQSISNKSNVKDTYKFNFVTDESKKNMVVMVNDKPISESNIDKKTLEKIIKDDSFLNKYTLNEVKNGTLPLSKASGLPTNKTYNKNADIVKERKENVNSHQM